MESLNEVKNMKFNATPRKVGNSYAVFIPKAYIDNDLMDKDKEYVFEIKEALVMAFDGVDLEEKEGDDNEPRSNT
jgi:antitoxin component of MazEF toxin-antitoxin module